MTHLQARKLPLLLTIVLGLASAHCAATTEEGDVEVDHANANAIDEQATATAVTGDTTTTATTGDEAADKKKPKTQQQVYLKVELTEVMVSSF